MAKSNQKVVISEERKFMYYGGMAMTGIGLLLFLSNFIILPMSMGSMDPFQGDNFMAGFGFRAVGGMVLIALGQFVMNIGKVGAAGAGLILDPEKAREDMKPWSQMKGGVIKDTLNEVDAVEALTQSLGQSGKAVAPKEVIKIKCRNCKALNDEDAVFCKSCGEKM